MIYNNSLTTSTTHKIHKYSTTRLMNEKTIPNWILWTILIGLVVIPYVFLTGAAFDGVDAQATEMIRSSLDYEPWFTPFWSPPGPEVESFIFALQAAIGSGVLFFTLGYFIGRRPQG